MTTGREELFAALEAERFVRVPQHYNTPAPLPWADEAGRALRLIHDNTPHPDTEQTRRTA